MTFSAIRILLIRHGETDWNRLHRFQGRVDVPLNDKGRAQAEALASRLKDESLVAFYSSPLARALETAKIIKTHHPTTPLFHEAGLAEMDLGEFDGMEAKQWAAQYPDFRKLWHESPAALKMPGGESLEDVQSRAIDAIECVTQKYPPESTLLFTSHNFVIRAILCHVLGKHLDQFRNLQQDTAAINILYNQGTKWWAEEVNDISHLRKI